MKFEISTPQSVGTSIAIKEARKASKRKATNASDLEPSPKKQKSLLYGSVLLPPAPSPAPAETQTQGHATTISEPMLSEPTEEVTTLVDASPSPAQTQTHNATDSSPAGDVTRKRKPDDFFPDSVEGNQVHNVTDLEPAPKQQKLSYATMHPARARKSTIAQIARRRLERWCRQSGHDYQLLDRLPDDVLTHPDFRAPIYMLAQSSANRSNAQGAPDLDLYPSSGSIMDKLIRGTPKVHAGSSGPILHHTSAQNQISAERSDSGDADSHPQFVQNATANASLLVNRVPNGACSATSDQTSTSLSSVKSTSRSPTCNSSDVNLVYDTSNTSSDRSASASSVRDIANDTEAASSDRNVSVSASRDEGHDTAARSDQIAPLSQNPTLGDSATNVISSQTPAVGPPRNLGGRPRGRKPRAAKPFKTPKGPMRFQKNHPVKAAVNVDIWENILSFCPPDFLLKARMVSSTFRSVLKDDSTIWKISRVKHFGSDMPGPPSGLSEPQYADLLTGTGCQTRGCTSTKARKTYWALQRRLCMVCFHQAFLPVSTFDMLFRVL